jgi:hypothetical protein
MPLVSDIVIGQTIEFQSKAANDNNVYHGKVIALATSDMAKSYADIFTYNANVQTVDSTVPEITLLEFVIIQLTEPLSDGSNKYIIPFAKEWILAATLNIISTDKVAIIKIYEVDATNVQDVIDLLKSAGFKARVEELR